MIKFLAIATFSIIFAKPSKHLREPYAQEEPYTQTTFEDLKKNYGKLTTCFHNNCSKPQCNEDSSTLKNPFYQFYCSEHKLNGFFSNPYYARLHKYETERNAIINGPFDAKRIMELYDCLDSKTDEDKNIYIKSTLIHFRILDLYKRAIYELAIYECESNLEKILKIYKNTELFENTEYIIKIIKDIEILNLYKKAIKNSKFSAKEILNLFKKKELFKHLEYRQIVLSDEEVLILYNKAIKERINELKQKNNQKKIRELILHLYQIKPYFRANANSEIYATNFYEKIIIQDPEISKLSQNLLTETKEEKTSNCGARFCAMLSNLFGSKKAN